MVALWPTRRLTLFSVATFTTCKDCAICNPPQPSYRHGQRLSVPEGSYVSIRGSKGVYHHADCYNVTGDWDGADTAMIGDATSVRTSQNPAAPVLAQPSEPGNPGGAPPPAVGRRRSAPSTKSRRWPLLALL